LTLCVTIKKIQTDPSPKIGRASEEKFYATILAGVFGGDSDARGGGIRAASFERGTL
jgi:hypothetical protein